MKAGVVKNHPWIGKLVRNRTNGTMGVVKSVERVHTFSQLVPFKTVLHITGPDGKTTYENRKDHYKLFKEDAWMKSK